MSKEIKLISWNVNGIRAVIKKGVFLEFVEKYNPDILCLQETKAQQGQAEIDLPQYEEYWNSATKKGYSGTAIFTKQKPLSIQLDIPFNKKITDHLVDDAERDAATEGRVVTTEYEQFYVVNVYTPNTKEDLSRLPLRYNQWDPLFLEYLKTLEKKKPVITCGDFNVAHEEIDLARPKDNEGKHGFTREEREGFTNMINAGFVDTMRHFNPDTPSLYTWWSHWGNARARNVGWRIDYVLVSQKLIKNVTGAFILPEVTGSDHCPVGITIKI